jgi:hypothetical protein
MSVASFGFCSTCGAPRTTADSAFCHKCGAAQQMTPAPATAPAHTPPPPAPRPAPVAEPAYSSYGQPAATTYGQPAATTYGQPAASTGLDYARNKKYFGSMGLALILIVVGVFTIFFVVGIFLIAAGVVLLLMAAGGPSAQELDAALQGEIDKVKTKALTKLNLDEDQVKQIPPVITGGYDFTFRPGVRYKRGADSIWRSSRGEAVAVFFSDDLLHSYKWGFSLIEPNKEDERTDEYFYRDVVSIATVSKNVTLERVVIKNGIQQKRSMGDTPVNLFELTTSGATSITCSMTTGDNTASADKGLAERRVIGARNLIKEKKTAIR